MSDVLDEDSAEIAFAALGLKVDGLGVQLARLEKASRRASFDYAPTLARMSDDIEKLELATRALYGAPALKMPVEEFERQLASARAGARSDMERALNESRTELHHAARNLQGMLSQARVGAAQNWRLLQVGVACWVLGAVMWIAASGPLARMLPETWAIPEKMAAATLGTDRWVGGQQMMSGAKPADWMWLSRGSLLVKDNYEALLACQRQATAAVKMMRCSVKVMPAPPNS